MDPSAINHIAINCRNLAAQEALFSKHFGFQRSRTFKAGKPDEYCSCVCVSVPFSRMPAPKQSKTTRASTKKKTKLGGPRPGAGRPPIQPNRAAVKIRLDTEVISAVDTIATLQKLDRSRVIEGALRQWLKQDKVAPGA
jgi:hypothetical protein